MLHYGAGDITGYGDTPAQDVIHADADLTFADHDFIGQIAAGDGGVGELAKKLFVEPGKGFDFLDNFSHARGT